jgi:hypothetical protein
MFTASVSQLPTTLQQQVPRSHQDPAMMTPHHSASATTEWKGGISVRPEDNLGAHMVNTNYVKVGNKHFALVPVHDLNIDDVDILPIDSFIDTNDVPILDPPYHDPQVVGPAINTDSRYLSMRNDASGRQSASSPKKWLPLEKYDGTNMSYETFRAKLAICAEYNNWSEKDQLAHLQTSLTHGAAQCLWHVGPEKVKSLSALLDLLRLRFGSENQRERHRVELRTRRQRSDETMQTMYQDIRRLLILAFPGPSTDTTEAIGRDAFLDSLADQELALKVRERETKTLEEALNVATRLEAYAIAKTGDTHSDSQRRPNRLARGVNGPDVPCSSHDEQMALLSAQVNEMNRKLNGLLAAPHMSTPPSNSSGPTAYSVTPLMSLNCGSPNTSERFQSYTNQLSVRKFGSCYNFGQQGHKARSFPFHAQAGKGKVNSFTRANGVHSQRPEDNVYLTASIGNFTGPCLVDTGCQMSLVPHKLVAHMPMTPSIKQVTAANGTSIGIDGAINVSIYLNDYRTNVQFLVTKDVSEMMLGMDFLGQRACRWDFASSTLWLEGRPLQLHARPPGLQCRRVMLTETVMIPAQSQAVVYAHSPLRRLNEIASEALVETRQIRPGLLVARTLLSNNATRFPLCVLNATDLPQELRRGEFVGKLEHVSQNSQVIDAKVDETISHKEPTGQSAQSPTAAVERNVNAEQERDLEAKKVITALLEKASHDLLPSQREEVSALLWKYRHVLSLNDFDMGFTELISHRIPTGDHPPIRETLRQHPTAYLEQIDAQVDQMLKQGVIEPCTSPWAANVVLVRKKLGGIRCAIDYRKLNSISSHDSYSLPRIQSCLDALQGNSWYSTVDLRSGFWQVRQDPLTLTKQHSSHVEAASAYESYRSI